MTKRDIALAKVQREMAENTRLIKEWNLNAIMSENRVKTCEKLIKQQEKVHNDRINKLRLHINRAVDNAKESHDKLDELLEEKEALHLELKKASHFGLIKCEFCDKYFTPQGIARHKTACSSKPEAKIVKEHKEEVKEIKDDIEARKAALQKELENLEQESTKKLNEEETAEPPPPEPEEEPKIEPEEDYTVEDYAADDTIE